MASASSTDDPLEVDERKALDRVLELLYNRAASVDASDAMVHLIMVIRYAAKQWSDGNPSTTTASESVLVTAITKKLKELRADDANKDAAVVHWRTVAEHAKANITLKVDRDVFSAFIAAVAIQSILSLERGAWHAMPAPRSATASAAAASGAAASAATTPTERMFSRTAPTAVADDELAWW